jgi:chitin disaccharide deacetylase
MKYWNVIDARRDGTRRHIWLCADDYGMSPAVNVAIRDLVVRGRINATSVMVVSPNLIAPRRSLLTFSMPAKPTSRSDCMLR